MTPDELTNHIRKHLPAGFRLDLCMENGSGWVELTDEEGKPLTFHPNDDRDVEACVLDALSHAQAEVTA